MRSAMDGVVSTPERETKPRLGSGLFSIVADMVKPR
jgi:hypothetical protein